MSVEQHTVVKTTFPYPLIWDSGDLDIRIEDKEFHVHFARRGREPTDERVSGSGFINVSNLELPYDRLDRVAHAEIEIRFPMYVPNDIENRDELRKWIHAVINRLLDVYRYTTEECHVEAIPRNELRDFQVMAINADTEPEDWAAVIGSIGEHWLQARRTQPIPAEAQQMLRDGTEPPIPAVLYLNAKREELFENYRIAVVEAESAFEVLVDQAVTQYYRGQGRSDSDIENILEAGLSNLIEHHIPRCCGETFEGTTEHIVWKGDLYNLRNSVVHDGASVDANQARKALTEAKQAIEWIKQRATV